MKWRGRHRSPGRLRLPVGTIAAVACLLLLGVYFHSKSTHSQPTASVIHGSVDTASPVPTPTATQVSGVLPTPTVSSLGAVAVSRPVRLSIPSIGVNTALQPLGLLADGTLQSPSQWEVAGWYAKGVYPGQIGPAVIAGHIDSTKGPAVFYRLIDLTAGAKVAVTDQNGAVLTFVVDSLHSYPKNHFPAQAIYGPSPYPELRLITCTGDFDWTTHNYLDNLVVSTHLVAP